MIIYYVTAKDKKKDLTKLSCIEPILHQSHDFTDIFGAYKSLSDFITYIYDGIARPENGRFDYICKRYKECTFVSLDGIENLIGIIN